MVSKTSDQANNSSPIFPFVLIPLFLTLLSLSLSIFLHIFLRPLTIIFIHFSSFSSSHPDVRVEGECSDIASFDQDATPSCLVIFSYNLYCIIYYTTHSTYSTHRDRRREQRSGGKNTGRCGFCTYIKCPPLLLLCHTCIFISCFQHFQQNMSSMAPCVCTSEARQGHKDKRKRKRNSLSLLKTDDATYKSSLMIPLLMF